MRWSSFMLFPSTDARMVEMIRLKCPFDAEPRWKGKYSDRDRLSWKSLNSGFLERYRPLHCKDPDEYWLSMEDFRCNFGGLIICSGKEPFRLEGFNVDRVYSCTMEAGTFVNNNTSNDSYSRDPQPTLVNNTNIEKYPDELDGLHIDTCVHEPNSEIIVKENKQTVKMDTTKENQLPHNKIGIISTYRERLDEELQPFKYASLFSSELQSTYSASDISVNIPDHRSRENSLSTGRRKLSFPLLHPRRYSIGSISHLTQSNFLAQKTDSFRSHGVWKVIIEHYGKWTKQMTTGSEDLKTNSNNPRSCFAINNSQISDDAFSPPPYRGKSHVLVSLLQDCRHGPSTANSLLVPIGFGVYKTKSSDKDEKRPLSKLQIVAQFESAQDQREVSGRLDLEEGNYVIVPYCKSRGHEGSFLLRMLGDKRTVVGKVGCILS